MLSTVALVTQRLSAPRRGLVFALLKPDLWPAGTVETEMPGESFGFSSIGHVALLHALHALLQRAHLTPQSKDPSVRPPTQERDTKHPSSSP